MHRPGKSEPEWHVKATNLRLTAGTRLEVLSAGGGGRGNPVLRKTDAVLEDVRQGYVTAEGAKKDYGVEINASTMTVDEIKTTELRKAMDRGAISAVAA